MSYLAVTHLGEKPVATQNKVGILHCNKILSPESTTMTKTNAEINAFIEASRKLAEPMARFQELGTRTFERVARYNYEVAGDLMNFGLAALQLTAQSKDLPELFKKQADLANAHFEKQTQRSQDFIKIASAAQADVTQFIDRATTEFTARAQKAA